MYYVKKDLFETGLEEGGGREIENYSGFHIRTLSISLLIYLRIGLL